MAVVDGVECFYLIAVTRLTRAAGGDPAACQQLLADTTRDVLAYVATSTVNVSGGDVVISGRSCRRA